MRVWEISTSPSNREDLYWAKGTYSGVESRLDGDSRVSADEFAGLEPRRPLKKDVFRYNPGVLALSDRAHCCLEDLLDRCAQSVRIDAKGHVVWIENILAIVDCLGPDTEMDCVHYFDGSKYVNAIFQYDILQERIGSFALFKLVDRRRGPCYCTDAFVRRVAECGLEGFRFVLAWDSELPAGTVRFRNSIYPYKYYIDSGKRGRACLPRENPDAFGQKLVPLEEPPAAPAPSAAAEPAIAEPAAPSGANPGPAPYDGPALDGDIRALREEALASLPSLPAAAGSLEDGPCGALGSRVCGLPAMLPGEEWPEGPGGEPLCFLAQLDMADLPPLPGFTEKGLLRLFVGEEPEFGLDPSDMAAQAGFRALWAPDPEGAALRAAPEEAEDGLAWGEGPWAVRFGGPFPSRPEDFDARAQSAFAGLWNAAHPDLPVAGTRDAGRYASNRSLPLKLAIQAGEEAGDPPAVQVGGYPSFVQAGDPRSWDDRYRRYDALLFQLSSDHGRYIEVGDGGRMYFFIPSEKLAAGDFSDIMYWWDCG